MALVLIVAIILILVSYRLGYNRGVDKAKEYAYGRVNQLIREQFDFERIK